MRYATRCGAMPQDRPALSRELVAAGVCRVQIATIQTATIQIGTIQNATVQIATIQIASVQIATVRSRQESATVVEKCSDFVGSRVDVLATEVDELVGVSGVEEQEAQ